MLFSRTIKSAAALALLTIGFAAPVHAQFNKPIISGTWYEDRAVRPASTAILFTLAFAQIPPDKFLNVTNVSCNTGSDNTLVYISLNAGTTSGATDLGRPYYIMGNNTPQPASGGGKIYNVVTNQVYYKFGPGRFPTIVLAQELSGRVGGECIIVGNLTDD